MSRILSIAILLTLLGLGLIQYRNGEQQHADAVALADAIQRNSQVLAFGPAGLAGEIIGMQEFIVEIPLLSEDPLGCDPYASGAQLPNFDEFIGEQLEQPEGSTASND
jgi:hypothetical protein